MTDDRGLFARARGAITEKYLPVQIGKTFTAEDVARFFRANEAEFKLAIHQALYYMSDKSNRLAKPILRQRGNKYRIIDRSVEIVNWWDADVGEFLDFGWPRSYDDDTSFGFEENIGLFPNSLLLIAGEWNRGKSALCLNILAENIDKWKVTYFANEFNAPKFKWRWGKVDWVESFNGDGKPKFDLIQRHDNYEDVIIPDELSIIDWWRPTVELYEVNRMHELFKACGGNGVVVLAMQKPRGRDTAYGGEGTMQFPDVVLSISEVGKSNIGASGIVKVTRCKNPGKSGRVIEGRRYSYDLNDGVRLSNIYEMKD